MSIASRVADRLASYLAKMRAAIRPHVAHRTGAAMHIEERSDKCAAMHAGFLTKVYRECEARAPAVRRAHGHQWSPAFGGRRESSWQIRTLVVGRTTGRTHSRHQRPSRPERQWFSSAHCLVRVHCPIAELVRDAAWTFANLRYVAWPPAIDGRNGRTVSHRDRWQRSLTAGPSPRGNGDLIIEDVVFDAILRT